MGRHLLPCPPAPSSFSGSWTRALKLLPSSPILLPNPVRHPLRTARRLASSTEVGSLILAAEDSSLYITLRKYGEVEQCYGLRIA